MRRRQSSYQRERAGSLTRVSLSSDQPDSPASEILVVRHGQSTWNEERRWQGQADPPLSELGRAQASAAARSVGTIDAIVSSPQIRALETAQTIGDHVGVGPVDVFENLRERSAGLWSGLTRAEIDERWPDWVESDRRPEGWEPDTELFPRVMDAFDSIAEKYGGATLLAVCHGGVIIALEQQLQVNEGRVPNLHGRVVNGRAGSLVGGEKLQLIPEDMSTGGESNRV